MTSRGRSGGAKMVRLGREEKEKKGKLHSYNKPPGKGIVYPEVIAVKILTFSNLDLFSATELMTK